MPGIAFKGPEGIVLAADSRVTLSGPLPDSNLLVQAHYDNATKLLKVKDHDNVGAVTYGLGALGGRQPRTAHSYLPEFADRAGDRDAPVSREICHQVGRLLSSPVECREYTC